MVLLTSFTGSQLNLHSPQSWRSLLTAGSVQVSDQEMTHSCLQLLVSAYERELSDLTANIYGLILFGTPQQNGKSLLLRDTLDRICEALGKRQPENYRYDEFVSQIRQRYIDCFPQVPVLVCIERRTTVGGLTVSNALTMITGFNYDNTITAHRRKRFFRWAYKPQV